mmetsp:Transcript_6633/g.13927  ORF Transcript_6633/g.13927 Transcript_6633/m.13927 type:complete len:600 (+) Transcript_6633:83-1882(+)
MDGGNQNDGRVASDTSSAAAINQQYHALLTAASETAGSNTWKTYSGRLDGPDEFVYSDAWRYFKNSISRKFVKNNVKKRADVCPVCMEDPTSSGIEAEGGQLSRNGWYVTKACNHAVCRECLQNYANSLIADPRHSGALKCPCCPRLLTREDAKVALSNPYLYQKTKKRRGLGSISELSSYNDEIQQNTLELLAKWDKKVRDENLRSMTDFRPCPHCSNTTNNDGADVSSELGSHETPNSRSSQIDRVGGGFVTPECLAPINEERELQATRFIGWAGISTAKAVLVGFFLYYWYNTHQLSNQEVSNTSDHALQRWNAMKQIFTAIIPGLFLPVLPHAIRLILAKIARNILEKPVIVTCPCCDKEFNLNASAEFEHNNSTSNSESASQQWKNEHTRPCPSCSSPIMKDGGCNHVTCGKCKVNFCWACMRPRTSCKSYQCVNGAPYGNGFGDGSLMAVSAGLAAREREGRTLMEHIEHVEMEARRNLGNIPIAPYLAALFAIYLVLWVLSLLPRNFVVLILLLFSSRVISCTRRAGTQRQGNAIRALNQTTQSVVLQANSTGPGRRTILTTGGNRQRSVTSGFRTEGEMVAEAIARSLVEQ